MQVRFRVQGLVYRGHAVGLKCVLVCAQNAQEHGRGTFDSAESGAAPLDPAVPGGDARIQIKRDAGKTKIN